MCATFLSVHACWEIGGRAIFWREFGLPLEPRMRFGQEPPDMPGAHPPASRPKQACQEHVHLWLEITGMEDHANARRSIDQVKAAASSSAVSDATDNLGQEPSQDIECGHAEAPRHFGQAPGTA